MQPSRSQISALSILTVFSHIHLGIASQVKCNITRDGGNADLTCKIPSDMDIVQVTWQKRTGNSYETLVTHSKRFGIKISKPYESRLFVLQTKDPRTSTITLSQLEKEDDACFTAIFNIFPDGALKGEVCPPKLDEVREVVCKSPADFDVTLEPPQILTQHSEPNGNIIQRGRWLDASIFPVCNFQLQKSSRSKRSVQDKDKEFTIQCEASGTQKSTITWINEGQPKSIEEKMNKIGDVFTVSSTLRLLLSTLPKGERISCNISYNNDNKPNYIKGEDSLPEKNQNLKIVIIFLSISVAVLLSVVVCGIWFFLKRKPHYSSRKDDKAENGCSTPLKLNTSNNGGTPGTEIKQTKQCGKKNDKRKNHHSSSDSTNTNEKNAGTPGTEIKQRPGSTVQKNKANVQQNNHDSSYPRININEILNGSLGSETKPQRSSTPKKKKSAKQLFT